MTVEEMVRVMEMKMKKVMVKVTIDEDRTKHGECNG